MSLDVSLSTIREIQVFEHNITHNLGHMAKEAGIYEYLWRPEELDIHKAHQLIVPLGEGLSELTRHPEKHKLLNPENGWGNYDNLVIFVTRYLQACMNNPDATIRVSR